MEDPGAGNTNPGARRSVLIIDDDRDIRENLGDLLRDEGFVVEAAWNGAEARKRLESGFRPNLIILDLMMPVMDGVSFRAWMQETNIAATIPVIGLTAFPSVAVDFKVLTKPLRFDRLMDHIRTALH